MFGLTMRYASVFAACLAITSLAHADQTVFLDFTGATLAGVDSDANTANKHAFENSPAVTAFIVPGDPAKDTAAEVAALMMDNILAKMEADYKGFWVSFTKTKPTSGNFSSVDFGANTKDKTEDPGEAIFGTVDKVDIGNKLPNDSAWIFVDRFRTTNPPSGSGGVRASTNTQTKMENELANVGSHELAHLLGVSHSDDPTMMNLMDGPVDGTDKGFTNASKNKIAAAVGLMIDGKHVKVQELIDSILGAISEAAKLTSTFDPGVGINGAMFFNGDLPSGAPGTTAITGGTIKIPEGFHGEAFGINDPFGDQFAFVMPDQMPIVGFDPLGNPLLQDFDMLMVEDPLNPFATELIQMQLTGIHFDPLASLIHFPGTPGDFGHIDDTTGIPEPDLIEPIGGFIGDAQLIIDPILLGQGSFLDDLDFMLQNGFQAQVFMSSELDQQTLDFTNPGNATGNFGFRVFLPGDLDGDGFVGINDLNIILSNWNQSVPPGDPFADVNGDGFVGIDDLNAVLANWNAGFPPGSSAAIPEPATLALVSTIGFGLLRRRSA